MAGYHFLINKHSYVYKQKLEETYRRGYVGQKYNEDTGIRKVGYTEK